MIYFLAAADPALNTLEIHLALKDELKLDPSSSRCVLLKDRTFSGSCVCDGKEAFNVMCGLNLASEPCIWCGLISEARKQWISGIGARVVDIVG